MSAEIAGSCAPSTDEVSLFSDIFGTRQKSAEAALMLCFERQQEYTSYHTQLPGNGHSMIEVDSMHSAIGREKKSIGIFTTNDWKTISVSSRRKKNPVKVIPKKRTQFADFTLVFGKLPKIRNKDENGDTVNWLIGIYIQNVLLNNIGFDEQLKKMKVSGRRKHPSVEELPLNPVYNKILPISQATKSDLLELCKKLVIPGEYHAVYANLPCSDTPRDNAPEPAADDTDKEQTQYE
ncbi:hypothetical protein PoB_007178600 [Plakobranchus ocellatus]|uniref:Uncharacterized protein n=1 Tax=Plakobranchus ocellatus TaxID=259542 RepID=A0AAV4DMV5_9GAST|nr:hypothetical protein PoB_007178600 [Plakobranchus ocellatus]